MIDCAVESILSRSTMAIYTNVSISTTLDYGSLGSGSNQDKQKYQLKAALSCLRPFATLLSLVGMPILTRAMSLEGSVLGDPRTLNIFAPHAIEADTPVLVHPANLRRSMVRLSVEQPDPQLIRRACHAAILALVGMESRTRDGSFVPTHGLHCAEQVVKFTHDAVKDAVYAACLV
jgi:hypothetical protein